MDIMDLFKDFHERGRFGKDLNSIFLANRLKKVTNGLVNPAQNAFVEGRQILDASLIANEDIDSMHKRKERGILCKLDIEKESV